MRYLHLQIVAIGRNYLEHIKELGNTVPPEPFFFLKPTTSYLTGKRFEVPKGVLVHHEGAFTQLQGHDGEMYKTNTLQLSLVLLLERQEETFLNHKQTPTSLDIVSLI
jgi:hypothetical protein